MLRNWCDAQIKEKIKNRRSEGDKIHSEIWNKLKKDRYLKGYYKKLYNIYNKQRGNKNLIIYIKKLIKKQI